MNDIVAKVAERLKLSQEQTRKLRTTAQVAGADTEAKVQAVLAGIQMGEKSTAEANRALSNTVEYPQRVDECPICFAHMSPVTLASNRAAYFCPIHNVCMPAE
jgi:hypothetical protein